MKKIFAFLVSIVFFQSCITVGYQVPQPAGVKEEKAFPGKYLGKYISGHDTVIITSDMVDIRTTHFRTYPMKKIDSFKNIRIENNLVYDDDYDHNKGLPFEFEKDTIRYSFVLSRYYPISDSVVVKRSGHMLYVNLKRNDMWELYIVKRHFCKRLDVYYMSSFESSGNKKESEDTVVVGNTQAARNMNEVKNAVYYINKITPCRQVAEDFYVANPGRKEVKKIFRVLKKRKLMNREQIYRIR